MDAIDEDQLQLTRQFLLSSSGIQADPVFVTIDSPRATDRVPRQTEIVGRLDVKGWPIVSVRPTTPDGSWWVQTHRGGGRAFAPPAVPGPLSAASAYGARSPNRPIHSRTAAAECAGRGPAAPV
jgi:hypothetical protein